jgi:lipopolysaccharide export system protein LptC
MKLRRLLDVLIVYLPLIILGLLASGSWWLVRSMPPLSQAEAHKPVRQDPDYRLNDFSIKLFNAQGQMTRELTGKEAQHLPATKDLHIKEVRIFAENEMGGRMTAQAQWGIASDDGSKVTLEGQAQAIKPSQADSPQVELRGERLVALPDEERVLSDEPVRIIRGRDVFTANTMDFNSKTGEYAMQGRVRGSLAPKPPKP